MDDNPKSASKLDAQQNNVVDLVLEVADDINADLSSQVPSESDFILWINAALAHIEHNAATEVNIRVVSELESKELNNSYRGKNSSTNVLSFESDLPDFVPSNFIGDLAICAQVVCNEAQDQNKLVSNHWAHMSIHGVLHLLGYDHIDDKEAQQMEGIEIAILESLGINNPYQIT
ncbi:rRNA maturation RNase YbeY [Glaciecola sp. 2405UD65-10]|uniref:rRNA maturation RNase YbeY n=1 Tax=Glaciecola sp. 2405UD65-10 TaxID=3397244 RepID=UPI003B5B5C29